MVHSWQRQDYESHDESERIPFQGLDLNVGYGEWEEEEKDLEFYRTNG